MAAGSKHHVVPVQMIRRFANAEGRLYCLKKSTLLIPERVHGNQPRDILYRRHHYKGKWIDWDEAWLQSNEVAFGSLYPVLADVDVRPLTREESEVLVSWIISLKTRSEIILRAVQTMGTDYFKKRTTVEMSDRDLANVLRRGFAQEYLSLYATPGWVWRLLAVQTGQSMVLSDHPICHTMPDDAPGPTELIPLSKSRLIVGGTKKGVEWMSHRTVDHMNLFMASWANELIYADSVEVLEKVADDLKATGAAARLPFFGVTHRMATEPPPVVDGFDSPFDYIKTVIARDSDQI